MGVLRWNPLGLWPWVLCELYWDYYRDKQMYDLYIDMLHQN